MKKYMIMGILILTSILMIVTTIKDSKNKEYPKDFNFTYSFGVDGKEGLDTYSNTLKYSSIKGIIELKLVLTVEEKNKIYSKLIEKDFMNIPASFPKLITFEISPIDKSYLSVDFQNKKNVVSWNTRNFNLLNTDNPTEGNEKLKAINEIGTFIQQIISDKLDTMDLPEKPSYL